MNKMKYVAKEVYDLTMESLYKIYGEEIEKIMVEIIDEARKGEFVLIHTGIISFYVRSYLERVGFTTSYYRDGNSVISQYKITWYL